MERLPNLKEEKACPYVGLEAFREKTYFFGRDADTQELVDKICLTPLVIVLGASGSGKSSLVIGGVLPELRLMKDTAFRIVPPFVPGQAVLEHLVKSVREALGEASGDIAGETEKLRTDETYLSAVLGGANAQRTVITIDQFEEVFLLTNDNDRKALEKNLANLLKLELGHRVILTLRQEFETRVCGADFTPLAPYVGKETFYSVRPMGFENLRAAVERPAALVNFQFQPGIVDDLVKRVAGQPAALPLLQFTLRQLWKNCDRNRITWEVYRKVGDPLSALENSADEFSDGLIPQTKEEVKRILLELVRVDEMLEAYRQPVLRKELLKAGSANTDEVIDLLEDQDYVRVLPPKEHKGNAIVEVKHEALIRNWSKYRQWIVSKREEQQKLAAIKQEARRWWNLGKPREGLLTDWQLEGVKHLRLEGIEAEFVNASAAAIERRADYEATWGKLNSLLSAPPEDRKFQAENVLDEVARHLWEKGKMTKTPRRHSSRS